MRIRCLAVAVVAAASVAGAAVAARDAIPKGSYSATVRGESAPLNGTWKLTFGRVIAVTGPLTVTRNGALAVAGTFTATNGKLALVDNRGPYACKGIKERAGLYRYSLNGNKLKLTLIADLCTGRKRLLSGRTFTGT